MVRLEIAVKIKDIKALNSFTFQYGQIRNFSHPQAGTLIIKIYIPVWLDQKYL